MIKIMTLLFVVIAPTIVGISVVAILAMSSPIDGGTPLSQQGSLILMVVAAATVVALPISYIAAKMVSRTIGTQEQVAAAVETPVAAAPVAAVAAPAPAPAVAAPAPQTEGEVFAQVQDEALVKAAALAQQAIKK